MTEMRRFVTKKTTKCQKSKFNLNIKLIEKYLKHSYEELEYVWAHFIFNFSKTVHIFTTDFWQFLINHLV